VNIYSLNELVNHSWEKRKDKTSTQNDNFSPHIPCFMCFWMIRLKKLAQMWGK
jgi:hypothetical protein